jgi:hypothetical protein
MTFEGLIALGLIMAVAGVLLVAAGVSTRRAARRAELDPPPSLPVAGIENGQPLPPPAPSPPSTRGGTILITLGVLLLIGVGTMGALLLYALSQLPTHLGRPLRVGGRQRLCGRRRGTGSHDDARPSVSGLGAWRRAWLGERWLTAARAEHASVPAFHHLAAQLAAIDAPVALLARCRAAADDETRHARRCFAIARTYAGIEWAAGHLPAPDGAPPDLPTLAVESYLDGCLGEGIAADLAHAGVTAAVDPVIRDSLEMIARDEAAHAELAWTVVELCVERGGASVRDALAEVAEAAPPHVSPGPVALGRAAARQIATARAAMARARLDRLLGVDGARDASEARHASAH